MTEDEHRSLGELTAAAQRLTASLTELNRDAGEKIVQLVRYGRTNRRYIRWLAASMFFDLVLTIFLGLGFIAIEDTQDEINEVRTTERRDALCPLYRQFINADTPKARELARKNGQDMERRAEAFSVIKEGYLALNCLEFDGGRP